MAAFSILDLKLEEEEGTERKFPMPDFFLDLNIDQLMKLIRDQAPGYDLSQMFYRFPADKETERYRRDIYREVKGPRVFACLDEFCAGMRRFKKALANREQVESRLQKSAWHQTAAMEYCMAVDGLLKSLGDLPIQADGLLRLRNYLEAYVSGERYRTFQVAVSHLGQQLESFSLVLEIQNNRITVTKGTVEGAYDRFLGKDRTGRTAPFASAYRMSELEEELFSIYRKKYPDLFQEIETFAQQYPDPGEETILALEQELQYYLAFCRFQQQLEEWDIHLSEPEWAEDKEMAAEGLYDLALACSNHRQQKKVVSNDFSYKEGEQFFVVNGPNQGGKTTFARSLGQLIYFCKMGFDVPAVWANVHYFDGLLTHFSVEESMETGQGKLMEELSRLAPMMKKETANAFVIINELFTTAAHYDGCVMGAKVLEHFIQNGCRGIYVTHLRELGDTVKRVVTMTAMLDGTKEHRRTYKILRSKAEEEGYAGDLVKKYELTYEQLAGRLKALSEVSEDEKMAEGDGYERTSAL